MTTTTLPISQVRASLPTLVEESPFKKTLISVKGKVKAAIVDAKFLAQLEATLEVLSDPNTRQTIKQAKKEIKANELLDWQDIKDELGLNV